ncbi:hypothetical protein ABGA94_00665, partial [Stenotrophomonas sp. 3diitr2024]
MGITLTVVESEIEKAESFVPKLDRLYSRATPCVGEFLRRLQASGRHYPRSIQCNVPGMSAIPSLNPAEDAETGLIAWAERGLVPDAALRAGIRRL